MAVKKKKESAKTTKDGLVQKREKFCQLFALGREINSKDDAGDMDLFGNGTKCYIEVYNPKRIGNWYLSSKASAARLLSNVNVCKRVNELLEVGGFNNENVDKQHLFLLNQFADYKTKLGAIREFNSLKKRIENKLEITVVDKKTKEKVNKEIDEFINQRNTKQ